MSRPKQDRARSRIGQFHNCALCVEQTGAMTKTLTWMLEIPENSNTYALLGGRPRTWFCRRCANDLFTADTVFRDRNAHLELIDPDWWAEPATEAQRAYLTKMLDQNRTPPDILAEITAQLDTATKGQINSWIGRINTFAPGDLARDPLSATVRASTTTLH